MKTASRLCILAGVFLAAAGVRADERPVKVGVFDAAPLVAVVDGVPQGLYVDLLEAVAEQNGWRLEYVVGSWDEHRSGVETGAVDLIPAISYTAGRDSVLDFNDESFLTVWNQVYVRDGAQVRHILDLDGATVAMLRGDLNHSYLLDLAREFGATVEIRDLDTQEEVFAATARGEVDAGVATNVFGYLNATGFDLVTTPVVFAPFSLRVATAEGANADLLAAVDDALMAWHREDDSYYYEQLNHWFGGGRFRRELVSRWLPLGVAVAAVLLALLVLRNLMLRVQVRSRSRELERSELLFRTLFETAGNAIFLMQDGAVLTCNAKSLELFRCDRADLIGHTTEDISPPRQPGGEDSGEVSRQRMAGLGVGETTSVAWRHRRRDGSDFDAEVTLTKIRADGQDFVQAIVRDVTERRQLETDLRQAQKMEAIGTLAGGIAHDFNNILSAILGYSELAKLDAEGQEVIVGNLDQVLRAGERARELVQRILSFSRRSNNDRRPTDLVPVVGETLQLLESAIPSAVTVRREMPAEAVALVDPTGVYQVLMNLCTNACQALEQGGGELRVRLETRDDGTDAHWIVLEVADDGPGMDDTVAAKIFEPYFTTKSTDRGTGLGLAMVHGIVEEHEGRVEVETAPGRGALFRVWLPAAPACAEPVAPTASDEAGEDLVRVLMVDDEADLVDISRRGLKRFGFEIEGYEDPVEALAAFEREPGRFEAVVTDMTMPGMTGIALAAALLDVRPGLPVILCTGYYDGVTREAAEDLALASVLLKPVAPTMLASELRAALAEARGPAQSPVGTG